ncbi:hypothetical protein [Robertmurraya andreesenii]|uniref:Uncharacterized protein n=1 Tax=Anoxybacillus andreesenii TaxID=1325932 RepID=A0ABT9V887_9BACL|nr:hypothetical protein [Robertmurraya andreesenii]MDQ0157035.1 hypothetical protein [Robertmurraya andreesenii]
MFVSEEGLLFVAMATTPLLFSLGLSSLMTYGVNSSSFSANLQERRQKNREGFPSLFLGKVKLISIVSPKISLVLFVFVYFHKIAVTNLTYINRFSISRIPLLKMLVNIIVFITYSHNWKSFQIIYTT